MNQYKRLGIGIVLVLLAGGGFFALSRSTSKQGNNTDPNSVSIIADSNFTMSIASGNTDNPDNPVIYDYEFESKDRWQVKSDGLPEQFHMIWIEGTAYSYSTVDESWIAFTAPSSDDTTAQALGNAYIGDEFDRFKENATLTENQECPAGTCNLYTVTNYSTNREGLLVNAKLFIDTSTGYVSRYMYELAGEGTVDATFTYGEDISISAPIENVRTLDLDAETSLPE